MAKARRAQAPEGVEVGPVAQNLLLENDDVKIWQVDTPAGETLTRASAVGVPSTVSTPFRERASSPPATRISGAGVSRLP